MTERNGRVIKNERKVGRRKLLHSILTRIEDREEEIVTREKEGKENCHLISFSSLSFLFLFYPILHSLYLSVSSSFRRRSPSFNTNFSYFYPHHHYFHDKEWKKKFNNNICDWIFHSLTIRTIGKEWNRNIWHIIWLRTYNRMDHHSKVVVIVGGRREW